MIVAARPSQRCAIKASIAPGSYSAAARSATCSPARRNGGCRCQTLGPAGSAPKPAGGPDRAKQGGRSHCNPVVNSRRPHPRVWHARALGLAGVCPRANAAATSLRTPALSPFFGPDRTSVPSCSGVSCLSGAQPVVLRWARCTVWPGGHGGGRRENRCPWSARRARAASPSCGRGMHPPDSLARRHTCSSARAPAPDGRQS